MTKAVYDLVVKTGTYQKDGETKNRYLTIGTILQKEDGGKFILLDRTFNPAGVPVDDSTKDKIIVSMFKKQESGSDVVKKVFQGNEFPTNSADDEIPF